MYLLYCITKTQQLYRYNDYIGILCITYAMIAWHQYSIYIYVLVSNSYVSAHGYSQSIVFSHLSP